MLAFHLLSREKIRLFVKSWNSENNEMLAFHLLSHDKIDQRANFTSKMINRTDPAISIPPRFDPRDLCNYFFSV